MTSNGNFWLDLDGHMVYLIVIFAADFVDVRNNFFVVSGSYVKSSHKFASSKLPTMEIVNLLHCLDGKKFVV